VTKDPTDLILAVIESRRRKDHIVNEKQFEKMRTGKGFIAALDQSGGSTPKALKLYGLGDAYSNDDEMFDRIHEMRTRIITSPAFNGDRILGSILFEMTMDRQIAGLGSAGYLWDVKGVVPFVKVDKGLAEQADGVRLMKPMPDLDALLSRAKTHGVFGTKMRSVIQLADKAGIGAVVGQQFEIGKHILESGLVPIIEPEIDIHSTQKAAAEELLNAAILDQLGLLETGQFVMLKLTPPEQDDFYSTLVEHPNVLRVVALSGGYTREEANARLARNHGVVASFSRALTEGLTAQQSDADFDAALAASIESIYRASIA
jgi:fructose-bisphosphate aldolase class I